MKEHKTIEVKFGKWLWFGIGVDTFLGTEIAIYLPFTLISILVRRR